MAFYINIYYSVNLRDILNFFRKGVGFLAVRAVA
jgi:hypothetical protein